MGPDRQSFNAQSAIDVNGLSGDVFPRVAAQQHGRAGTVLSLRRRGRSGTLFFPFAIFSCSSWKSPAVRWVAIQPGAMQFTVIPSAARSLAKCGGHFFDCRFGQ